MAKVAERIRLFCYTVNYLTQIFETVATLTGKTLEVNVPVHSTALCVKKQLEDLEGWRIEDQSLRTTKNQILNDTDKLEAFGITPEAKSRLLLFHTDLFPRPPQRCNLGLQLRHVRAYESPISPNPLPRPRSAQEPRGAILACRTWSTSISRATSASRSSRISRLCVCVLSTRRPL